MASARDLKNKIKSISNTKKITRTMELVATSKAKKAQDRVVATTPYSEKLRELLDSLSRAGTVDHPLLETREAKRVAFFVITGNRGLCGGYNSNVLRDVEKAVSAAREKSIEVDVYMVGRKGNVRFRFLKLDVTKPYTHFDDRPSFADAADIAEELMSRFLKGEIDRVETFSTRFISAGTQAPGTVQLLPIVPPEAAADQGDGGSKAVDFLFEPDPAALLEAILPLSVKNIVYRLLVEAAASEQIARRVAMKRATDSAEEMVGNYTRMYNRQRQAGITQQINEIVSGSTALE